MTKVLADLIDAQGHRVIAAEVRPGLLTIVTYTLGAGASGHPCLTPDVDQAVRLRDGLTDFINRAAGKQAAG